MEDGAATEKTVIRVNDLSFTYSVDSGRRVPVLKALSLAINAGEYASIVGPSGCGKTTLLMCICGLLPSPRGAVLLGDDGPERARHLHKIGFVFQKPVFFEWLPVAANVELVAHIAGIPSATARAADYLRGFGLSDFLAAYPHELSGGMLSRAALARALVHAPDYLLLDEAFNHLDEALRHAINTDMQKLLSERPVTVLAVTHTIAEAVFMSDHVLLMSPRPSTIVETFTIPFPRPRHAGIRSAPEFVQLVESIREALISVHGEIRDTTA